MKNLQHPIRIQLLHCVTQTHTWKLIFKALTPQNTNKLNYHCYNLSVLWLIIIDHTTSFHDSSPLHGPSRQMDTNFQHYGIEARQHNFYPPHPAFSTLPPLGVIPLQFHQDVQNFIKMFGIRKLVFLSYHTTLLLDRLNGQYCFSRCRPSASVVVCNTCQPAGCREHGWLVTGGWVHGRSGGRHGMAGQYGYVPLGRHLVLIMILECLAIYYNSNLRQTDTGHRTIAYTALAKRRAGKNNNTAVWMQPKQYQKQIKTIWHIHAVSK